MQPLSPAGAVGAFYARGLHTRLSMRNTGNLLNFLFRDWPGLSSVNSEAEFMWEYVVVVC